jgi:multiple sugar transport system ATP-binding protein
MAQIVLEDVAKTFPDGTVAVDDISLVIPDGKLMVLVGPSGCGKTTVLRMIAGLEQATGGRIVVGDRVVNELTPRERDVAMVFQNYALYPHMSVYQNIALSLKIRHVPREEMNRRVVEAARILGIEDLLKRRPRQLSGGQRQRVAMGRAIVRHPQAFLMDEPLSNLDAKLRVQMRSEISRIQRELGVTTIYVTHDQTEAMTLGHQVAVINKGMLQQVGSPQELYRRPRNTFVAGFIGSPAMNLVEASLVSDDQGTAVLMGEHRVAIPDEVLAGRPALQSYVGRKVAFGIRPEDMEDAELAFGASAGARNGAGAGSDAGSGATVYVTVAHHEDMGSELLLYFDVEAPPVFTEDIQGLAAEQGEDALRSLEEQARKQRANVVARVSARSDARSGQQAAVYLDMRNAHFFDLASGESIAGDAIAIGTPTPATGSTS